MSRHHRAAWILCLCLGLVSSAWAQDSISDSVKSGSIGPTERATIEQFVTSQLRRLSDDSPSVQGEARDALVREAMMGGKVAPPAFLDAYADILNQKLKQPLESGAPPRQRLLAAIVAGKVADIARNTRLLDVVVLELEDSQMPIVLWGMKGARAILPSVLNNNLLRQQGRLRQAILEAVQRTDSLPVLQEAYGAATLGLFAKDSRQPTAAEIPAAVDLVQKLLEYRLEKYAKGIPDDPRAENTATLFLSHPSIWPVQNTAQQQQTAQELMQLLSFASQRYAQDESAMKPVVEQTAKAMYIITADPKLQGALTSLTRLELPRSAAEVQQAVQATYTALTAIPQFKDVKRPAELPAAQTEPASQP